MTYEQIKANFDRGLWAAKQVNVCVMAGLITEQQAQAIRAGESIDAEEHNPQNVRE